MICFDNPIVWKESLGPSSHLISDLPGEEGTAELVAFAERIGLRRRYLQSRGTRHEHFDIWGIKIQRALEAGALQIDKRRIVEIFRKKQEAMLAAPARKRR